MRIENEDERPKSTDVFKSKIINPGGGHELKNKFPSKERIYLIPEGHVSTVVTGRDGTTELIPVKRKPKTSSK